MMLSKSCWVYGVYRLGPTGQHGERVAARFVSRRKLCVTVGLRHSLPGGWK